MYKVIFLLLVLISTPTSAQYFDWSAPLTNPNVPATSFRFNPAEWEEDSASRTLYSASWKQPGGRVLGEHCLKPIHFKNEKGELQRIHADISRQENGWLAAQQEFPVFIDMQGSIHTAFGKPEQVVYGSHGTFNHLRYGGELEETSENELVMKNILPGIDKEFKVLENAVKTQFRIHDPIEIQVDYLEITEELQLPEGCKIERESYQGKEVDGKWQGNLKITNRDGKMMGFIQGVLCYDVNKQFHPGGYTWKRAGHSDNKWILSTWVDKTWLNQEELVYPVVIDPLVIGPLTMYAENFMPSCYIPDYFADSILVTVPGEITVTGLFVVASFNSDPGIAVKGDGSMYFSSPCGQTTLFEVQGAPADIAGMAYVDPPVDLQNDLMCCYAQSCSETSFYLRMHLGRYTPKGDCNYTYIYYTPITPWPFTAYIEGHTVESFGPQWTVSGAALCSNECEFEGTIRAKFGVPPYTFTHDWMTGSVVAGSPQPCDPGNETEALPLEWPGCPVFCPNFEDMEVPPPTITDACGNTVAGLPMENLNLKPSPDVVVPLPVEVCSNTPTNIPLSSCEPGSSYYWSGNGASGTGNFQILQSNETGQIQNTTYEVYTSFNGCNSDTVQVPVAVIPSPMADFFILPSSPLLGTDADFISQSSSNVGDVEAWNWTINGGSNQSGSSVEYTFETLDSRTACLEIVTEYGCRDTVCKDFQVITADVFAPNIFTPNADGKNDVLEFKYLEFFPENELKIWNRWGTLIFEQKNYKNDWTGEGFAEAAYYYILHVKGANTVDGYFHLVRGE